MIEKWKVVRERGRRGRYTRRNRESFQKVEKNKVKCGERGKKWEKREVERERTKQEVHKWRRRQEG